MSPRKRKKSASVSQVIDASLQVQASSAAKAKVAGACLGCRARKIRCDFAPNAIACKKCIQSGQAEECVVQESRTRSRSTSAAPSSYTPSGENSFPTGSKRQTPQSTDIGNPRAKRPCHFRSGFESKDPRPGPAVTRIPHHVIPGPAGDLTMPVISELDEQDDFLDEPPSDLGNITGEILSVVTGCARDAPEFDPEDEEDETSEVFDLDVGETTSEELEDSEHLGPTELDPDTDDDMRELLLKHSRLKPPAQRVPAKRALPAKTVGKGKGKAASAPKPTSSAPRYNPDTCLFKIQCAVHRVQGSKTSNVPFQILSTISYDELRLTVAEKLNRFAGLIKLQYRLDCKAKTAFTSVQSDEELDFFIETMRPLIVPPCLANGKASTRPMKSVTVFFDDAASEDEDSVGRTASTGNQNKTGARGSGSRAGKPVASDEVGGTDVQEKHVEELQRRWTCDVHSKGPESPTYCYTLPGSTVCQGLSHQNIAYWALLIMKEQATLDTKPAAVVTQGARPRTRNTGMGATVTQAGPGSSVVTDQSSQGPPSQPSSQGPSPVTVQFMSPWPGHGHLYPPPFTQQMVPQPGQSQAAAHVAMGYPPSPNLQPTALPQVLPQSLATTPSSEGLGALTPPFTPLLTFTHSTSDSGTQEVPAIVPWFEALEQRIKCDVKFGELGPILKRKGFVTISQLSREYITTKELQEELGIEKGTAILILQNVDNELRAISSGSLRSLA